jgi:hypothetical protein
MLKIYKIQYNDFYYIGSTSLDLQHRLYLHTHHAKQYPHRKIYKTIEDWKTATISQIDEGTKETENKYINNTDPLCLNTRKAVPLDFHAYHKEYRKTEKYKTYQKKYREEHREEYNAYMRRFRKATLE